MTQKFTLADHSIYVVTSKDKKQYHQTTEAFFHIHGSGKTKESGRGARACIAPPFDKRIYMFFVEDDFTPEVISHESAHIAILLGEGDPEAIAQMTGELTREILNWGREHGL